MAQAGVIIFNTNFQCQVVRSDPTTSQLFKQGKPACHPTAAIAVSRMCGLWMSLVAIHAPGDSLVLQHALC